mmetsp:Transcript_5468/g.12123  ORF Transcript_5468/g.12123 Transcript_5468/m.12123 type:complete len:149 (+) Transcript_5468:250-696(+)
MEKKVTKQDALHPIRASDLHSWVASREVFGDISSSPIDVPVSGPSLHSLEGGPLQGPWSAGQKTSRDTEGVAANIRMHVGRFAIRRRKTVGLKGRPPTRNKKRTRPTLGYGIVSTLGLRDLPNHPRHHFCTDHAQTPRCPQGAFLVCR